MVFSGAPIFLTHRNKYVRFTTIQHVVSDDDGDNDILDTLQDSFIHHKSWCVTEEKQ